MIGRAGFLVFTNAYPYPGAPHYGTYVSDQVRLWRDQGAEVEVFFINGRERRLNYFRGVFSWTWKMLRNQKRYAAIVVHHSYCCLIACLLRPLGLPVIYQVHEGTIHFSTVNRWLVKLATRMADEVVYVSGSLPEALGRPIPAGKIIPCGVDLDLFQPLSRDVARQTLGWNLGEEVVLYAAKERKHYERYDLVINAVELLRKKGRRPRLLRLEGVEREMVPWYLNAADVVVVASRGEGSPKIVKEALACNRPIVSLRVGAVPRLVEGIKTAFLSEATEEALAEQIELALGLNGNGSGREQILDLDVSNTASAFLQVCRSAIRPGHGHLGAE